MPWKVAFWRIGLWAYWRFDELGAYPLTSIFSEFPREFQRFLRENKRSLGVLT